MYTIEVHYTTGNSFGSHEETDQVGYAWNDIELAKKALQDIKEHYQFYHGNECTNKPAKNKSWCIDCEWPAYRLKVLGNDNKYHIISAYWIGYFESLISANVTSEDEDDMEYIP